jgi:hypothetical protein
VEKNKEESNPECSKGMNKGKEVRNIEHLEMGAVVHVNEKEGLIEITLQSN